MVHILSKIKKCWGLLTGLLPSQLPKGVQEFDQFCAQIFFTYDLPDLPSYRSAIATMILHLGPTVATKPKLFFARSVKKAMANQVAYEQMQLMKKQEAEADPITEATPDMVSLVEPAI